MATESDQSWPIPPKGAPCWIEIMSAEPTKLKDFYSGLFPAWKFRPTEANTERVLHYEFEQPSGLTGGIIKLPDGCKPSEQPMGIGSTIYYFVNSIDEIEKDIVKLGGVKVLDRTKEGDHGFFANFKDLDGNRFGVYEVAKKGE